MSCGCVYVDDLDGPATVLSQKIVKARKQHRCCNCDNPIKPSVSYEKIVTVEDGGLYTYKTCEDCLSIRDAFFCTSYYFEFIGPLQEHIYAIDGNVSSECIESLTPRAKERIIDMIDYVCQEA